MRSAILGRRVEQEDTLPYCAHVAGSGVERFPLDVQDDQRALPREAIRDGEAAGLTRTGPRMERYMLAPAEAKVVTAPGFPEHDVIFPHQNKLLEDRMPPERRSASVAHALLPYSGRRNQPFRVRRITI